MMLNKDRVSIGIFIILIVLQLLLSFALPAYKTESSCWVKISNTMSLQEFQRHAEFNDSIWLNTFSKFFPNYHWICDVSGFMLLVKDGLPWSYQQYPLYRDQPLYPFIIALFSFIPFLVFGEWNVATVFAGGILANIFLVILSAVLLYKVLKRMISQEIAFSSTIFFIFSPFIHLYINQPTSSGVIELFVVSVTLWL